MTRDFRVRWEKLLDLLRRQRDYAKARLDDDWSNGTPPERSPWYEAHVLAEDTLQKAVAMFDHESR